MGRKHAIGIVIDLGWPVAHHYQVAAGIQRFATECGEWECFATPCIESLLRSKNRWNGIIGRVDAEVAALARDNQIPVVNVWLNSPIKDVPTVISDFEESGRMVARHLLQRGFRSFGYCGYKKDESSQLQLAGFRSVLDEAGYDCLVKLVPLRTLSDVKYWGEFHDEMNQWVDHWTPPIGVLVNHDICCRYLAEICRERGLLIPYQVALVGSGNEPLIVQGSPSLSSLDFGYDRLGYQAANLLNRLINGAEPPGRSIQLAPSDLLARESSNAYFVAEPLVSDALQYIARHFHEDIDVESVANGVSTVRRTLERVFKKSLGCSVYDAITRTRLDQVKHHLIHTRIPVKSVATKCGFASAIHLSKVFRRVEGSSPTEYRQARTVCRDIS